MKLLFSSAMFLIMIIRVSLLLEFLSPWIDRNWPRQRPVPFASIYSTHMLPRALRPPSKKKSHYQCLPLTASILKAWMSQIFVDPSVGILFLSPGVSNSSFSSEVQFPGGWNWNGGNFILQWSAPAIPVPLVHSSKSNVRKETRKDLLWKIGERLKQQHKNRANSK